LKGFAPAESARDGDLTFAENEKYFARAEQSGATAIITDRPATTSGKVLIRVKNPRVAFARVMAMFFPEPTLPPGVHASAVVAASAEVDPTAHIGPHSVVGERAKIGPRAVLQGGNHIGAGCQLAEDVNLFPNVTLYPRTQLGKRVRIHAGSVIGADGFGYVMDEGKHRKVPQVGNVIIGDDVEIGAMVGIDRGALGPTVIGKGTKIDNLVQIGHNTQIGEHCIIIAQCAIAGSVKIGNYTVIAGNTSISGHLKIGNQVTVGGQSGVMHDIPDGEKWWGSPAQLAVSGMRQAAELRRLPEIARRVRAIEKKLGL
jgi:UDP-3-O-[3-hydroxymyristoyl] glucosamine N-acyltransferase